MSRSARIVLLFAQVPRARLGRRIARAWQSGFRASHAEQWARACGSIGRAELAEPPGVSTSPVNDVLRDLVEARIVEPSNPSGKGRGPYYRPVQEDHA